MNARSAFIAQGALALPCAAGIVAACNAVDEVACGPGTRLSGDTCILAPRADADAGAEATPFPAASSVDATQPTLTPSDPEAQPVVLLQESTGRCPKGLPGPALVEVNGPSGAICVDSTEVTRAQYAEFLAEGVTGDAPVCGGNSLMPGSDGDCPIPFAPEQAPNAPVVCVDWCDADAYCAWAGKRLCAGPDGAFSSSADIVALRDEGEDVEFGELAFVCSAGGSQRYAYGNQFDEESCSAIVISDVGTNACEGPANVHDLTSSVSEWTAICHQYESDTPSPLPLPRWCLTAGGNAEWLYTYGAEEASRCGAYEIVRAEPGKAFLWIGIRCCAAIE